VAAVIGAAPTLLVLTSRGPHERDDLRGPVTGSSLPQPGLADQRLSRRVGVSPGLTLSGTSLPPRRGYEVIYPAPKATIDARSEVRERRPA
jgi:hypothetical protein